MAFSATLTLFFLIVSFSFVLSGTVVQDLNTLQPPPDFNSTIAKACLHNPSLRYCSSNSSTAYDLQEIFKSTIVASHLCNASKNPNCVETFSRIDLHGQPNAATLYLSFNFFWKFCPLTVESINLSNNSLKGDFPFEILYCSQIKALDLSLNDLSGDFPVQNFSSLHNLTLLNLSCNHFSEVKISDVGVFNRFNSSGFIHSGLLPDHREFRIKAVFLLAGFPILIMVVVIGLGWLWFRRPDFLPRFLRRKHKFTPAMIKAATDGLSRENLVARSEGVAVFRGLLRDGYEVRIDVYRETKSRASHKRFIEECKIMVQLCHKNLIKVLGWCEDPRVRAIVTEWIDGEDTETWLSDSNSAPQWSQRKKVITGVIEAITYLHEEWPQVKCDLQTKSILLTSNGEPILSRFRVDDHSSSTRKIYKLGVFILEMVTNRRPREEFEGGEAGFMEWVRMSYPDNLQDVIDMRMRKNAHVIDQAAETIAMGLMCTRLSSGEQPSWEQISNMVSGNS